jgi:hypothetical protein
MLGNLCGISKFLCLLDSWLTASMYLEVPVTDHIRVFTVSSDLVLMSDNCVRRYCSSVTACFSCGTAILNS